MLSDYQVAIHGCKIQGRVYVLMSERNGYQKLVACFDNKDDAIAALDRCFINAIENNDGKAKHWVEDEFLFYSEG